MVKVADVGYRHYTARFLQAAALQTGNPITIAGIPVGEVTSMKLAGDHVEAGLKVRKDVILGEDSRAIIKVTTILGSRYLALEPEGPGSLPDNTFDLGQTEVPYDLQEALADVTTTYEQVDSDKFAETLGILGKQLKGLPAVLPQALENTHTLSTIIADRRDQLGSLLKTTEMVSNTLRRQQSNIGSLINQGNDLIGEFVSRRESFQAMMACADQPRPDAQRHRHRRPAGAGEASGEHSGAVRHARQARRPAAQHAAGRPRGVAWAGQCHRHRQRGRPQREQRSAGRLLDVCDQRAGKAIRDDPVLPGLQVSRFRSKVFALVAAGLVLAVVVAAAGWSFVEDTINTISVTAQFDSAAGLYEGNTVAVLGMPVGKVTTITPKGGYVEVEFTVDKDVAVPADAQAVTISNSILTDRQIELTPPYRGGPTLKDHDTIGLNRTKTPVEFARVLDVLDKLSGSLHGDGAGNGPVADLVNASASIADGNGQEMKDALGELSNALRLSADRGAVTADQLTTIMRNLSSLLEAAATNDATSARVRLDRPYTQSDPGRREPRHRYHRQETQRGDHHGRRGAGHPSRRHQADRRQRRHRAEDDGRPSA